MNIRDMDTYVSQIWDWSFLNDCFGETKIRVTDVDGLIERNGHFLLIETKMPKQEIPVGQAILFEKFAREERHHVLIVWGYKNKPVAAQFWGRPVMDADEQSLKAIIRRWFKYANGPKKQEHRRNG